MVPEKILKKQHHSKKAFERSPREESERPLVDACNLREGLCESLCGKWSGDKDTGDGEVKKMHDECKAKEKRVKNLQVESDNFIKTLLKIKQDLECDMSNIFSQK